MTLIEKCIVLLTVIISFERICATVKAIVWTFLAVWTRRQVNGLREEIGNGATIGGIVGGAVGAVVGVIRNFLKGEDEHARPDSRNDADGKDDAGREAGH